MALDPAIEHIQHLLQSAQLEEASTELLNLLRSNPRSDQAWTIASQLTSESQQRKEFLRWVFDCSSNTELADWALRNLGQLENEMVKEVSLPPIASLVVLIDMRIPLDDLMVQATSQRQSAPQPATEMLSQGNDLSAVPPSAPQIRQDKSPLLPFSMKALGKWIMLGAGLLFICIVFTDPFIEFFGYIGLSPLFCCFLPLFLLGALTLLVGFFVDKK